VDLQQEPADIVILSAADTDLRLLADVCERLPADFPSVRLASLLALRSNASVDLYFDAVLSHARVVVVALIGGASYWPYGVERLVERAREPEPSELTLLLVPGDDNGDPELGELSSHAQDGQRVWRYLREGGPDNALSLLQFLGARYFGRGQEPPEARPLPGFAIYHPAERVADLTRWQRDWHPDAKVAAVIFYRAHLQAANLDAFDALIAQLTAAGLNPLPISVISLKDAVCRAAVEALLVRTSAAIVLNTTGFAVDSGEGDGRAGALGLDRPVLQVIMSGGNAEDWREQSHGLSPSDLAMSVVLPEVDGRIITRAVSFKGQARRSERTQSDVVQYRAEPDRVQFVAELAARWVALADAPAAERRIALVLANYPARDGRLGNGVGLDTPASTLSILRALVDNGYAAADVPEDGDALMRELTRQVTNDLTVIDTRPSYQSLSLSDYQTFLQTLPAELVASVDARWGPPEQDPRVRDGRIVISGIMCGEIFVGIQPARGYEIDWAGTYHDPELVPPHGYLAFYAWLRTVYRAHAIVHVGKHGNLEWLPGKSVALSANCYPDAILGPTPHLYPFIVNDPGEGSQAKRRAQAVVIDHLMPALTRAESYGPLRDLERLVDEYYQAVTLDAPRALSLRREILSTARKAQLHRELGFEDASRARAARTQEQEPEDERFLRSIDAYLCELKESQIRDGLHVFGCSPEGVSRVDTLVSLARVGTVATHTPTNATGLTDLTYRHLAQDGLLRALARALFAPAPEANSFDPLDCDLSEPWRGPRPQELVQISPEAWRTRGDTRERLELFAHAVLSREVPCPEACRAVVRRVEEELAPLLDRSGELEIAGLLAGLDGRYVPPGPSGAPTRGRLDVLPTGRNFYAVDVRAVPTPAAYRLAERAASRLVERYVQDHGAYPRSLGLSLWGTATMRTGGDDVAQALALLGVRPVWSRASGRVVDTEILPASALTRPRVDVVLRISGFFRDAFADLIRLMDAAVRAVAELDEDPSINPLRARVLADAAALRERGVPEVESLKRASFRIFGSKPGTYGTGLQSVIDGGHFRERSDLAEVYLAWGSYAYSASEHGQLAREDFQARLEHVDAVLQNQDNREHDVLDSDDYYQFQGGMSAAVELTRGQQPALYHGDNSQPEAPRIRTLREEVARVVRSRVVNPKWIAGMQRHGYKGAAEMAATVDFLFGYDAATDIVEDYQYAMVSEAYVLDAENRAFLERSNPSALRDMTERLLSAIERGMWKEPSAELRARLEEILLDAEEREL